MTFLDSLLTALGSQWFRVTVDCPDGTMIQHWTDSYNNAEALADRRRLPVGCVAFWQMVDGPSKNADENQPQTMIGRWQCRRLKKEIT